MNFIKYGHTKIYYTMYKQERRDIKITVDLVNGVLIYVAKDTPENEIEDILKKRAKWIYDKQQSLNEVQTEVVKKEFVSGEKFEYLGRSYRLKVHREAIPDSTLKFKQGKFIAEVPHYWPQIDVEAKLKEALIMWYRNYGIKKIHERAQYFEKIMGTEAHSIQLRTQHKRWGTCTPEGNIYLNWRIVMAPMRVIDYIIVHELAHLRIPEHNEKFWQLIKSILPKYEESKEWLRVNGTTLYAI